MPYFSSGRREDMAAAVVATADVITQAGLMYPLDLSAATGDVTVSFPHPAGRTNRESSMFGVIVTNPNVGGGHRVAFDLNGNTFQGDAEANLSFLKLGNPTSDRAEFLVFQKLGGSWYVVNDGRARIVPE